MRKPACRRCVDSLIETGRRPPQLLFQRSWAMLMHRSRRIIIKCGRSEIWWWWLSAADSTVSGNLIGKTRKKPKPGLEIQPTRNDVERFYNRRAVCLDAETLIGSSTLHPGKRSNRYFIRPCFRQHPIFLRRYMTRSRKLTAPPPPPRIRDPAIKRLKSNKLVAAINLVSPRSLHVSIPCHQKRRLYRLLQHRGRKLAYRNPREGAEDSRWFRKGRHHRREYLGQ